MPYGLQVFRENGTSRLFNERISRVIGSIQISGSGGSASDPGLLTGTPWFALCPLSAMTSTSQIDPQVTISGSLITWGNTNGRSYRLIYGVY